MTGSNNREGAQGAWGDSTMGLHDQPFGRHTSTPADTAPLQRSSIVKKINPEQKGARRLAERFGNRMVCVRYRTDPVSGRRFTTVEIVVEERAPTDPAPPYVLIRVGWKETDLRRTIKELGGVWLQDRKLWRVPSNAVKQLRIRNRVVQEST